MLGIRRIASVALLLTACSAITIMAPPESSAVTGRTLTTSSGSMAYQWSGIEFALALKCPVEGDVAVLLNPSQEEVHGVSIACDGQKTFSKITVSTNGSHPLGSVKGECVVTVRKLTEAWGCNAPNHAPAGNYIEQPPSEFLGFEVPSQCTVQPASQLRRSRRIEIVGDSISCGYGNLGNFSSPLSKLTCMLNDGAWAKYEDVQQSYGALVAQELHAEYHLQCIAGVGLVHSAPYGVAFKNRPNMSLYVDRALPCVTDAPVWEYSQWEPAVLVVNIGTNDYILGVGSPSEAVFVAHWTRFVTGILKKYVTSPSVVAVCGPMAETQCPYVAKAIKGLGVNGVKTAFVNATLAGTPLSLKGCAGHPTTADHREMAALVMPAIQQVTGW